MEKEYEVIIVGGGPTGAALGIELGLHNIKTLILEKYQAPLISPRAQSLNARTMELMQRWQIAAKLSASCTLPANFPHRGVWCSKLNGQSYAVSSHQQSNAALNYSKNSSTTKALRIPLWITEDILRERLETCESVTFCLQHQVTDLTIDNEQAIVMVNDKFTTETNTVRAQYVVGCDGANSITRQACHIEFTALAPARRVLNVLFEAPELTKHITVPKGFLYYLLANKQPAAMGPVDIRSGLWYTQVVMPATAQMTSVADIDVKQLLAQISGIDCPVEILDAHFWQMQIQIAKQFSQQQRVFLVGDSAHAFAPTGGLGLNTGFGDVTNLAWKLAAVLQNQAHPSLLDSYEQERRPICLANLAAAEKNASDMVSLRRNFPPERDPTAFATANAKLAKQHTQSAGLTMGYAYFDSPLSILQNNQDTTAMPVMEYTPTAKPGYFLPHVTLICADHAEQVDQNEQTDNQTAEVSIYTLLSPTKWTLLISDDNSHKISRTQKVHDAEQVNASMKPKIAAELNNNLTLPVKLASRHDRDNFDILLIAKNTYPDRYLLIRPDWHIAYAGDGSDAGLTEEFFAS